MLNGVSTDVFAKQSLKRPPIGAKCLSWDRFPGLWGVGLGKFWYLERKNFLLNHKCDVQHKSSVLWCPSLLEVIRSVRNKEEIRKILAVKSFVHGHSIFWILEFRKGLFWAHRTVAIVVLFLWLYQGTTYACNPWEKIQSYQRWYPQKKWMKPCGG